MHDDIISKQQNFWSGKFGSSYIERNDSIDKINQAYKKQTGITVEDIFKEIFGNLDKDLSILELGCNIGTKLQILNNMGFKKLHGVEINQEAANLAQNNNPSFHIFNSSIEEFDSEKNHFDIVFTSGVLIHVDPNNITQIIKKKSKWDDHDVSPKIRQVLQHWGYKLTEDDYKYELNRRKIRDRK